VCGIVACRGHAWASNFLMAALHRLEYRGYGSAGVAVTGVDSDELQVARTVGRVAELARCLAEERPSPELGTGIGHTRWATDGGVSRANAHPHRNCTGTIAVVHKGIVDNSADLRVELLQRGHEFTSQVDTEVVAHLVEEEYARTGFLGAATPSAGCGVGGRSP
jgi:glutamine---fructose-6-phosphate transaminase (isomerizing)